MICRNSIFFIVFLTISFSARIECNDNEIQVDETVEKLKEAIKENLPKGVEIPASLQNVTLPSIDDFKKVLKEKCQKVSPSDGSNAYDNIEKGASELQQCTSGLIDVEQLQKEIQEAEPIGELDTVFNKYCSKRDIAIGCMENFTSALEPCLEPKEIEGKRTFVKIFKNLLNFVCHKEGDQIALFIAEKGPECFDQRKDDLINCMNSTFYGYLPSEKEIDAKALPSELPELVMGEEQCNDMDRLQLCVVDSLEKCEESTPANLVESMFKFVRNETPCVNMTSTVLKQRRGKTNDAYISAPSSILIATLLVFIGMRVTA